MKFVINGGSGYIGFHIGKDLVQKGHSVLLFDLVPPNEEWKDDLEENVDKNRSRNTTSAIPFFKGNLLDRSSLETAFRKQNADCVIHCASYGMSGLEQLNWDKTEEINIQGTVNALNACVSTGVKAFVYTSTFNVVFGGQEIHNGTEDLDYFPLHRHVDHYSRTKSIAEQLVLMADGKNNLRTTALRLAGVIGLKEKRHLPRIVDAFPMFKFTYSHPQSLCQFINIQNVVQAHVKGALSLLQKPEKVGGEAFFVSDGVPINNFEFFRPLMEGLGYTFPTLNLPLSFIWIFSRISIMFPSLIPILTPAEVYKSGVTHYFSNGKAEKILGYQPTRPNDISDIVKYYQEKQRQKQKHMKSSNQYSNRRTLLKFLTTIFIIMILYVLFCRQ